MDTATNNSYVSRRIDVLMSIDPAQTRAFLLGLQSGYYMGKDKPKEEAAKS